MKVIFIIMVMVELILNLLIVQISKSKHLLKN